MNAPENLIDRLISHDIEFVIVGGYAALAHGCTLLTQDLDICFRCTPETLMQLQRALNDLHPVHRMTPKRLPLQLTVETCGGIKNLYLDTDWGVLDCMSEITGLGDFDAVCSRSQSIQLSGGTCLLLQREALIESKTALGRPRDLEAVKQLRYLEAQETQRDTD